MDPVTMMVASVGLQFFNNYANNEKNKEIQAQQREFQKAAQIHDFERMRKAQSEAARLSLELEEEVHNERIKDIEDSYDIWLKNLAHSFTINNWPLNVLPFVMKGESFGSLFSGTSKSINVHCILTPSNCEWFNHYFYDDLDLRVEAEMNGNWNSQTNHPIVYYGGAWNKRKRNSPTDPVIPENINLVDIALLENQLKQFPTMVITPYFDPYLHFRVKLWGMGKNSSIPFRIDIPYGDIDPSKRIFSHDYCKENKLEDTDDLFNTTMEEMVPYLVCLIGFIADKYFWSLYGVQPFLPQYLFQKPILLEKLYMEKYSILAKELVNEKSLVTLRGLKKTSTFIDAISPIIGKKQQDEIEKSFVAKVQHNYIPIEDKTIPETYESTISFLNEEAILSTSMNWVSINDFDDSLYKKIDVEKWDIIDVLTGFQQFVESKTDSFSNIEVSIYIEEKEFKTFIIHVYDVGTKKILQSYDGFDYYINTKALEHNKNVKSVFKYEDHNSIICRYSRIQKLIERIKDNSLIF